MDRIERFRSLLLESYQPVSASISKPGWEDAEVRKQRKRAEGLARQRALKAASSEGKGSSENEAPGASNIGDILP